MPHPITQPYRSDPARRLPGHLRPNLSEDAQQTIDALDRRRASHDVPATAITRLDIPFEDVFALVLKVFAAQVIIGGTVGVIIVLFWFMLIR